MFLGHTTIQQSFQRHKQTGVDVSEEQQDYRLVPDRKLRRPGVKTFFPRLCKGVKGFLQNETVSIHSDQREEGKKQRETKKQSLSPDSKHVNLI